MNPSIDSEVATFVVCLFLGGLLLGVFLLLGWNVAKALHLRKWGD